MAETSSLIGSFATVRDGVGAGLFPDGTVSLPALRFAADQDTGLRRIATNAISIVTGGVDAGFVDNLQRFGFGEDNIAARVDVRGDIRARSSTGSQIYLGDLNFAGSFALRGPGVGAVVDASQGIAGDLGFYSYDGVSARLLRYVITGNGTLRPAIDNNQNLGTAAFRLSTIFAGTGTINTSDEREKVWRGSLNEAELRAAKRIAAEIGIFQFLDAVAEKGADDARLHCGVRAQQVFAILEDEGLEWQRYAWCCYDEWEAKPEIPEQRDDEGNITQYHQPAKPAGDRYGIRADQLALWLIAAQEQRLQTLEA